MKNPMPNLEWSWQIPCRAVNPEVADLDDPLETMRGISGLTAHALKQGGLRTIGEFLQSYAAGHVAAMRGIGFKRLTEIGDAVKLREATPTESHAVPTISIADLVADVSQAANGVTVACPDGFVGGWMSLVERADGLRVVMRWRVPGSVRRLAGKLANGLPGYDGDKRFHFLESRYINAGFQGDPGKQGK